MMILLSIFFLQFTDKVGAERVCLSPTAMEMREARGIAIDSLDYEVSPIYLDSVQALGASVLHTSRWMNGATVQASDEVIEVIEACEFVDTVYRPSFMTGLAATTLANYEQYLRKNILPYMGDMPMDAVNVATLQQFYDWMANGKKHGRMKDLNRNSIARIGSVRGASLRSLHPFRVR